MPDDNKFEKLRSVGYGIPGVCRVCQHGQFGDKTEWGTCAKHKYEHRKHANPDSGRGVSIHVMGTCPEFETDPVRLGKVALGAHLEFFDAKPGS